MSSSPSKVFGTLRLSRPPFLHRPISTPDSQTAGEPFKSEEAQISLLQAQRDKTISVSLEQARTVSKLRCMTLRLAARLALRDKTITNQWRKDYLAHQNSQEAISALRQTVF